MDATVEIEFLEACEIGDLKAAKSLAKGRLIDTTKFDNGWTPLMRACYWSGNLELVKYLIELGLDVNEIELEGGSTALFEAATHGHVEVMKFLLKKGADIDHQDFDGYTALMWCVISPEPESIDYLLNHKADISLETKDGQTFLSIVKGFDNEKINEVVSKFNL